MPNENTLPKTAHQLTLALAEDPAKHAHHTMQMITALREVVALNDECTVTKLRNAFENALIVLKNLENDVP